MPISDFVKSSVHGRVVLKDGSGSPVVHAELYDLGDISVSGLSHKLNNIVHHQRRGKYVSSSYSDRKFPTLSMSAYHTGTAGSAPGSIADWMLRKTPYGTLVSTLGAGRVWACTIEITWEGTDFGDTADGFVTVNKFCPTDVSFNEQMDGNRWAISGDILGNLGDDFACSEI